MKNYKGYKIYAVATNGIWYATVEDSSGTVVLSERGAEGSANRDSVFTRAETFVDGL